MKKFIYSIVALIFSSVIFAKCITEQARETVNNSVISIKSAQIPLSIQTLIGEYLGGEDNFKKKSRVSTIFKLSTFGGLTIEIESKNITIKKIRSYKKSVPFQLLTFFPGEVHSLIVSQFAEWKLTEVMSGTKGYDVELRKAR